MAAGRLPQPSLLTLALLHHVRWTGGGGRGEPRRGPHICGLEKRRKKGGHSMIRLQQPKGPRGASALPAAGPPPAFLRLCSPHLHGGGCSCAQLPPHHWASGAGRTRAPGSPGPWPPVCPAPVRPWWLPRGTEGAERRPGLAPHGAPCGTKSGCPQVSASPAPDLFGEAKGRNGRATRRHELHPRKCVLMAIL